MCDKEGIEMEDNKEKEVLTMQEVDEVSGGSGYSGGYCPYTEDRNCRLELVGSFDNDNEDCRTCGWRAW